MHFSMSEDAADYRALAKLGSKDDPMDRTRGPIGAPIAVRDAVCSFQVGR
jgi:hypothetical protein